MMIDSSHSTPSTSSSADLRHRLATELGLPSRLGYTALLLAGVAGASVACALLLTEVGLPVRTRIAFVGMALVGLAWAGFAIWVLARRRVLFASHRVIAARMAVAFSAIFLAGALLVGFLSDSNAGAFAAAATGAGMLAVAAALLQRARRRVNELTRRRIELERLLADAEGDR